MRCGRIEILARRPTFKGLNRRFWTLFTCFRIGANGELYSTVRICIRRLISEPAEGGNYLQSASASSVLCSNAFIGLFPCYLL